MSVVIFSMFGIIPHFLFHAPITSLLRAFPISPNLQIPSRRTLLSIGLRNDKNFDMATPFHRHSEACHTSSASATCRSSTQSCPARKRHSKPSIPTAPLHRLRHILLNTLAYRIAPTQLRLSICIPLLSSLPKPLHRLYLIRLNTIAVRIAPA